MISTNQIAYFTQWSIFEVDENHLAYFQSYKSNDWLVEIMTQYVNTKFMQSSFEQD